MEISAKTADTEWMRDLAALRLMRTVDPTITKTRFRERDADGRYLFAPDLERRQHSKGAFIWMRRSQVEAWIAAFRVAAEPPAVVGPALRADEQVIKSFRARGGGFARTAEILERLSA